MKHIDLQVDDDGAIIITIQPGALPLGQIVDRLAGISAADQRGGIPFEVSATKAVTGLGGEAAAGTNHHDAIQRWIAANGPASPADVRAAFKHLAPNTVKRALKAMEDEGIITASGTTSNRKLQVA